jgi:hypothetical protein
MLIYVLRWRPSWISDRHKKNINFVEDLPMIIPGQFGFNCPSGFREEAFWDIFLIVSNVKLTPAVALFFYVDRISKMAATAGHILSLYPKVTCSNAFFSETTNMIKAKLYMNVHWMVLYKLRFFVPIWNSSGGHLGYPIDIKKHKLCRGPSNDHSWAVWC